MRGGAFEVPDQPILTGAGKEKIFRDVKLVPLGDLNGPSFDESSAFQGIHGMTGEMRRTVGLHLKPKVAWAQSGAESLEIDDREGHYFIGGQIIRECSIGVRWQERNLTLEFRF